MEFDLDLFPITTSTASIAAMSGRPPHHRSSGAAAATGANQVPLAAAKRPSAPQTPASGPSLLRPDHHVPATHARVSQPPRPTLNLNGGSRGKPPGKTSPSDTGIGPWPPAVGDMRQMWGTLTNIRPYVIQVMTPTNGSVFFEFDPAASENTDERVSF